MKNLGEEDCKLLIDGIHGKQFFERKMFCNGIVPLTPEKRSDCSADPFSTPSTPPATALPGQPASSSPSAPPLRPTCLEGTPASPSCSPATQSSAALSGPLVSTVNTASQVQATNSEFQSLNSPAKSWNSDPKQFLSLDTNLGVVRRHSISLSNRTPPRNSIAAEIINSTNSRTKLLVDDIKSLSDRLSDFNSCISDSSRDESINDSENEHGNRSKTDKIIVAGNDRKR